MRSSMTNTPSLSDRKTHRLHEKKTEKLRQNTQIARNKKKREKRRSTTKSVSCTLLSPTCPMPLTVIGCGLLPVQCP